MNRKGFTLIELLVVVLIIGILAAIALPQYFKAVEKSRATEALSIMGSLAAAMERARLVDKNSNYPSSLASLDLEFANASGQIVTGSTWSTRNFNFTLTGGAEDQGKVTAERSSGTMKYSITRYYRSGRVACSSGTSGICASLGLDS